MCVCGHKFVWACYIRTIRDLNTKVFLLFFLVQITHVALFLFLREILLFATNNVAKTVKPKINIISGKKCIKQNISEHIPSLNEKL